MPPLAVRTRFQRPVCQALVTRMLRTFLIVYLWVIVILMVVFSIIDILDQEQASWIESVDYLVTAFALFGVFSYCYGNSLVSKRIWRIFLPVLIVWDIYVVVNIFREEPVVFSNEYGIAFLAFFGLALILILVPCYLAIYLLQRDGKNGN